MLVLRELTDFQRTKPVRVFKMIETDMSAAADWSELCSRIEGKQVVLDVASMYVYLGTLVEWDAKFVTLEQADVHDLRDTSTSRERYVLDSRQHGINVNRQRVHIRWSDVMSLSVLEDVCE